MPNRVARVAEARRGGLGRHAVNVEREGRDPAFHAGEAVQRHVVGQACQEALAQRALVRPDRVPADRLDVLDRRDEAGEQLVRERSRLEAVTDRFARGRPNLVRPPALEQLRASERDAEMRTEELVGRADEHIDAPVADVDRPVWPVVHGVRPGERAGVVRELDDAADVRERADGVRCDREGDDARAAVEVALQVVEVDGRVVVDVDEANLEAFVMCELQPG